MDRGQTEVKLRSEQIREDIERTRAEMDETMEKLTNKLRPRHLIDEVVQYFRTGGGADVACSAKNVGNKIVNQIKENPVPALLVAGGIAWLVAAGRKRKKGFGDYYEDFTDDLQEHWEEGVEEFSEYGERVKGRVGRAASRLKEYASDAREKAGEYSGQARKSASRAVHALRSGVSEKLSPVASRVQHGIERGRHQVSDITDDYPLAMGAACMAVGVLTGLMIPATRRENRLMGEQSDEFKSRLRDSGEELVERGKHVVESTVQEVSDAARREGLTPSALMGKAQRAAEDVAETAADTARSEARSVQQKFQGGGSSYGGKSDAQKAREQANQEIDRLTQS